MTLLYIKNILTKFWRNWTYFARRDLRKTWATLPRSPGSATHFKEMFDKKLRSHWSFLSNISLKWMYFYLLQNPSNLPLTTLLYVLQRDFCYRNAIITRETTVMTWPATVPGHQDLLARAQVLVVFQHEGQALISRLELHLSGRRNSWSQSIIRNIYAPFWPLSVI